MVGGAQRFFHGQFRKRSILLWLASFTGVWYLLHSASLLVISHSDSYTSDLELVKEYLDNAKKHEVNYSVLVDASKELSLNVWNSVPLSKRPHEGYFGEICRYSQSELTFFPHCETKLKWMEDGWMTHDCYADNGVDGSLCSFAIYLSEVENHCPYLRWRKKPPKLFSPLETAESRSNPNGLFDRMSDSEVNYDFIKSRISRMWPKWVDAFSEVMSKWPNQLLYRKKLTVILIHLGFLTKEAGFKFGQKASSGGPLGELVQWSDLMAALHILGHKLWISSETSSFKNQVRRFIPKIPCPDKSANKVDLLFTDIIGIRYLRRKLSSFYFQNKCILRVLDSFGSHAEFNIDSYFKAHKKELGGGPNPWGGNLLELQQFMTMYPHTDDNTFLGFVVETHPLKKGTKRENATLVYGKEIYMWKDARRLLKAVSRLSQLHATVADVKDLSNYTVINHGLLSGTEFHLLLQRVKIFLGLGFPLEGPAPLEAIANGAVFLNPKFSPPKSRRTYQFFKDKPTLRELTSQNPYIEHFIGRPYALTVDMNNLSDVQAAILDALTLKPKPFLPFEFTATGMLQRVNILINKQDFCSSSIIPSFPPLSALQVKLANSTMSCQKACSLHGLVCERSFFVMINNASVVTKFSRCESLKSEASPFAPFSCVLQSEPLLFSCGSVPTDGSMKRICPCRDYIKNQVALCSSCL